MSMLSRMTALSISSEAVHYARMTGCVACKSRGEDSAGWSGAVPHRRVRKGEPCHLASLVICMLDEDSWAQ